MSIPSTPDLCDANSSVQVLAPILRNFGGRVAFGRQISTIKCFEDNALLKTLAGEPGNGGVVVVDGGGSCRRALLGDMIAADAIANGWTGVIIYGSVRDVDELAALPLGVQVIGTIPVKPEKRGIGDLNVPVTFGGVTFTPGQYVYAENNGVICADAALT